jgi:hypothetical protein
LWYGHNTNQQGHFRTASVSHWLAQYNAMPPRVLIEDEANYEQLKYASMTENVPGWLARQSAYQSQVGGAAGFTYGGQGIWWACYNRSYVSGNCGPNDKPGTLPADSGYYTWDQALAFPVGGQHMSIMAAVWRRLPFHLLEPDGGAIVWAPPAPNGTQMPYQKAVTTDGRRTVIAYLPQINGNPHRPEGPPGTLPQGCRQPNGTTNCTGCYYGGTLVAVPAGVGGGAVDLKGKDLQGGVTHTLSWMDPRTGVFTVIRKGIRAGDQVEIPATRPGEAWRDWVLLLEPSDAPLPAPPLSLSAPTTQTADASGLRETDSWVTEVNIASKGRLRTGSGLNGCSFTAASEMNVTHLCRFPSPGADNIVPVVLSDPVTGKQLAIAQVDARLSATNMRDQQGFVCAKLNGGVDFALKSGSKYLLECLNDPPCDPWYDDTSAQITVAGGDKSDVKSVYGKAPHVSPGGGGANHCYGPLSFHFKKQVQTAAAS